MTPFRTPEGGQGAKNMPNPGPSAPEGFQAASDEMRGEVARALGYAGVSPFEIEDFRIEDVADRLHRAGYRRVSVDDDTVERVAEVLHAVRCDCTAWADEDLDLARAAVQVLRGGQ